MTAIGGADVAGRQHEVGPESGEGLSGDGTAEARFGARSESTADHAYFLELEELFIGLRGAPLMLSPADWQVAQEWRRRGVPLELVRRVMREVFEKRRQRESDDIVSLRYFRRPVEGAWKKVRELAAGGERAEPEAFDLEGRLERLASALPGELLERGTWAERIRALAEQGAAGPGRETTADPVSEALSEAASQPDLETVEEALGRLDDELLEAVSKVLDADAAEALWGQVEEVLERLKARLPEEEIARSREHLRRRLLRERSGLPVLSLFSPAAEGD